MPTAGSLLFSAFIENILQEQETTVTVEMLAKQQSRKMETPKYFHLQITIWNWNYNNISEEHLQDFKFKAEHFKGIQAFLCLAKHYLTDLEVNKTKTFLFHKWLTYT